MDKFSPIAFDPKAHAPRVRQFEAKNVGFWRARNVAMRVSGRFLKKPCSGTPCLFMALFDKR